MLNANYFDIPIMMSREDRDILNEIKEFFIKQGGCESIIETLERLINRYNSNLSIETSYQS